MPRLLAPAFLITILCTVACAQSSRHPLGPDLVTLLNFEREHAGGKPAGWGGGPAETLFIDDAIVHSGKHAARIARTPASKGAFSSLTASVPLDAAGQRIELRGFLRTENVTEFAGLWMREDGLEPNLAFDNMQRQQLKGTNDWREYSIALPLHRDARTLTFGVLVGGTGTAWADDLRLLVDGKPIWEAPKAMHEVTVLDRDREFEAGSKVELRDPTPQQIDNLATLGRVWGFLKYNHPKVTSGQLHWDYELFRVLPAILAAADRTAANEALSAWIDRLGELRPDRQPALPADLHLRPDLAWLDDRAALGERLCAQLRAVHAARAAGDKQFYLSLAPNVGNPVFDHERAYTQLTFPDAGYHLLALFRFWNIYRYWSPYRDLVEGDWDATLAEFIPRFAGAANAADYQRELIALIARVHDSHANLWSNLREQPPAGNFHLPAVIRFIEGRATVVQALATAADSSPALQRGDVILALDGQPVEMLVKEWSPYYAASNEPTRLRDLARNLGRGPAVPAKLRVLREGQAVEIEVTRVPASAVADPSQGRHDLPGPAFRLLSPEVAYLKLSAVKLPEIGSYVAQARGTQGWVIDIRNYPSAFVVFALGSRFVEKSTEFARFTIGAPANPGAFAFTKPLAIKPEAPRYAGKIVVLVDEVSQSNAEYTAMALRAAPGAIVVGSTTAGADGNVSRLPLPGGQHTMISGIGVFYPDKRPTQRIGIVPDIEVRPTLAGILAGRDEVLETALRQILGPEKSDGEIRRVIPSRD